MKRMHYLFNTLFLLVFSFLSFSLRAQSLSDSSPTIKTYKTDSTTYTVYVDTGSSGATTSSNAHTVYIPITKSTNQGYHVNNSTNDNIPAITAVSTGSGDVTFTTPSLTSSGGTDNIYLAVEDDSDWKVIYKSSDYSSGGTKTVTVPIEDFCTGDMDCTDFYDASSSTSVVENATYYMFATSSSISVGASLSSTDLTDTSNYPGITSGVYYNIYFSNSISSSTISLNSISKGDNQLIISFSGFSLSNVKSLYFYGIRGSAADSYCRLDEDSLNTYSYWSRSTASSGELEVNESLSYTGSSGIITVDSLENSYCYSVRVYYKDKFGFASLLSKRINQTPEDIETLLAQQQCYILTAGFSGDHPVVRFFRSFRDTVLMKFHLGRAFIHFYYDTAPQYTPYILKNPWLQNIIRSVSTGLYFTLRFWQASLCFLFLMLVGYTLRRIRLI